MRAVLRVFCSISTKHTKHPKNIEKHWKTQKLTIRLYVYCGSFPRAKISTVLHKTPFTKHLTSAKHCKTPRNTAKQSENAFIVKLRRKTLQNARKTLENSLKTSQNAHNTAAAIRIARIRCFLPKYARSRSVAKAAHNTQYTPLRGGGHVPAGGHVAGLWMFFKNSVLRCFAVFCGVLRCFVCVFLAFFTRQHKTDQKVYKTHKTNKIHFVQYSAIRCCASFSHALRKCLQKTFAKHVQNIAKHPQNTAKHCTVFLKTLAKHHKTPAKHPPQNTAKHRKTPQNTFANKTDRIS